MLMANYKSFCKRFCKASTTQPLIVQIDLIFGQLLIVLRIATAIQESGGWEVPPLLPPCPPSTSMAVGQPRHAPLSLLLLLWRPGLTASGSRPTSCIRGAGRAKMLWGEFHFFHLNSLSWRGLLFQLGHLPVLFCFKFRDQHGPHDDLPCCPGLLPTLPPQHTSAGGQQG